MKSQAFEVTEYYVKLSSRIENWRAPTYVTRTISSHFVLFITQKLFNISIPNLMVY